MVNGRYSVHTASKKIILLLHKKIFKKVLTSRIFCAKIPLNLNITKNDGDEEGWNVTFTESCRLVRDNDRAFL